MEPEFKHFTLDEAQSLLPVLRSLLERALEARAGGAKIEEKFEELSRRIFISGGLFVDVERTRKQRAAYDAFVQRVKDSLAEIEAIGVQVKDLDTGLLDFPCLLDGETVLLCWKMGEDRIEFWHTLDSGFRGRQPLDERFTGKKKPNSPN